MGLLVSFDEKADFWKMCPQMKTVEPFKTSFKKKMPSDHMWAIAFLCDPSEENVYRNIPEEEKMIFLRKKISIGNNTKNISTGISRWYSLKQRGVL